MSLVQDEPVFNVTVWDFQVLTDTRQPTAYAWNLTKDPAADHWGGLLWTTHGQRLSAGVTIHDWPDSMTFGFDYKDNELPAVFYVHGLSRGEYNCAWEWPLFTMTLGPWPSPIVKVLLFANFPENWEGP